MGVDNPFFKHVKEFHGFRGRVLHASLSEAWSFPFEGEFTRELNSSFEVPPAAYRTRGILNS